MQVECYVEYLKSLRAVEEDNIKQGKSLADFFAAGPNPASSLSAEGSSLPSQADELWHCRFDSGRVVSRGLLLDDLQSCWRILGFSDVQLPTDDLPELPPRVPIQVQREGDVNPEFSVVAWLDSLISAVHSWFEQIERTFRTTAQLHEPTQQIPTSRLPTYLGLTLDPQKFTVSREGYPELKLTRLPYEMMLILMTNQDTPSRVDALTKAWSNAGLSETPEIGTVRAAVHRLKRILGNLGITIKNSKNIGWCLQEPT